MTYPYGNGDGQQNGWNQANNGGWQQHGYGGQQPGYDEQQYQSYYGAQQPHMGGYNYGGQMPEKPNNYLVWSILSTLFCCMPTGIAAIIFATQVDKNWNEGNVQAAANSSAMARTWTIVSAVLGGLTWAGGIFYFVYVMALIGSTVGGYY